MVSDLLGPRINIEVTVVAKQGAGGDGRQDGVVDLLDVLTIFSYVVSSQWFNQIVYNPRTSSGAWCEDGGTLYLNLFFVW